MNYLKISVGILFALAASRFIPHPPNFTSLLALSFYVPALLGTRFIPALMLSFILTDIVIGFHNTTFFTWGSILVIGLMSNYFTNSIFLVSIKLPASILYRYIPAETETPLLLLPSQVTL